MIKEGTYHLRKHLIIKCPISIHGAGQDKTVIQRYGFKIQGRKEEKKRVDMQGMTMIGSEEKGLDVSHGLSFLCKDMTFTHCGGSGVYASNTKGRLINCVITQCEYSGIKCGKNALIEVEGDQTKVDGNLAGGYYGCTYGLDTYHTSSIIHFLFPLTKESVSTNNEINTTCGKSDRNYGGSGTIETVNTFDERSCRSEANHDPSAVKPYYSASYTHLHCSYINWCF